MNKLVLSLCILGLMPSGFCIAETYSDDYIKAYEALQKGDCKTAITLLKNEQSNNITLNQDTINAIDLQVKKCEFALAKQNFFDHEMSGFKKQEHEFGGF